MATRDNPGPSQYRAGEHVYVRLPAGDGQMKPYGARVVRTSRTHLHVRVIGSGSELALTIWDTKLFVSRVDPVSKS